MQRLQKEKAGASSRTPSGVIYKIKYITDCGFVKSDFGFVKLQ